MKPALLLLALALAGCAGASEAPSCRGEAFSLNPSRTARIPASDAKAADFR